MDNIEFGLQLPSLVSTGPPPHGWFDALQYNQKRLSFKNVNDIVLKAEKLGYQSVWLGDHLNTKDRKWLECWTTLSALATTTKKIRLGTIVLCYLHRHPGLVAHMSSTLDLISDGRLEFGIGACGGVVEEEVSQLGQPFPKPAARLKMMTEYIEVIKKLWTQEQTSYQGKYYTLQDAFLEPKPVQKPHPPILIGGGGEQLMLKIVAKYADKCNFIGSPEVVKRKLDILSNNCSKIGRDYESITKTMNLYVVIAQNTEEYLGDMKRRYIAEGSPGGFQDWLKNMETYYVSGTPEECLEKTKRYIDLGIQEFIIRFGDFPKIDELNLFAKDIIAKLDQK